MRTRERSPIHGYDTKFAMHALRIGHQGLELLRTGRISLPVGEPARSHLRAVRAGEPALADILAEIADVTARLEEATAAADLPDEPDSTRIDSFLCEAYERFWAGR